MTPRVRAGLLIAAALVAGASLSACSSTGDLDLDPATWFPDGKKKLPGDRREVFPGGVPGVTQGVPPELIKGSPQQQAAQNADAAPPPEPPAPEPKAAEKPKPRPKKVARPAPPPADPDAQPAPSAPRSAQRQAPPSGAWPAPQGGPQPQQPQQPVAPANAAWPAPPASGTFTR